MKIFNLIETSFENYDRSIRAYLSRVLGQLGMQYKHSQLFGVIFDGMRGIMQNAMFYIEDALTEQNIFTATRQRSVYSLAKLSGYEPYYGAAAVGSVLGVIDANLELNNRTTKVYIPNYSKIVNAVNKLSYIILLPSDYYMVDLSKPIVKHEFKIVQGRLDTASYFAKGVPWEVITLDTKELWDREYFYLYVDGEKWTQVPSIYDMTENGHEYVLTSGYEGALEVMFGNGNYGAMLENGQGIEIRMIKHVGLLGNIQSADSAKFVMQTSAYDSLGNTVNLNGYMAFRLQNPATGGVNSDSTQFIRSMIGFNSRSLVLASTENFQLFFKRFSFVGYVNCWSERNSMCITATCLSKRPFTVSSAEDYFALSEYGMLLSNAQKEMIVTTLANSKKTFAGVTLKFQDPIIRNYAVICYVKVDEIYNKDIARTSIETYLAKYFLKFINNTQFIAKSSIIKYLLDSIPSITSIDIDILSELAEQTYINGYYNRYELRLINGVYKYVPIKVMYEPDKTPGLDMFGNISLSSKLEIPLLHGNFKYYYNKGTTSFNTDCEMVQPVQVHFV